LTPTADEEREGDRLKSGQTGKHSPIREPLLVVRGTGRLKSLHREVGRVGETKDGGNGGGKAEDVWRDLWSKMKPTSSLKDRGSLKKTKEKRELVISV
jgi:hypothetical protein